MVTYEEIESLLMQLNRLRERTRGLAETEIAPGAVLYLVEQFQLIEDKILTEVVARLRGCVVEAEICLERLSDRVSAFESEYLHTPPLAEGERPQVGA